MIPESKQQGKSKIKIFRGFYRPLYFHFVGVYNLRNYFILSSIYEIIKKEKSSAD